MPWLKMDDNFITNHKLLGVGKDAKLIYFYGLGYSARELTDGLIQRRVLRSIAGLAGADNCEAAVTELLDVGLWDEHQQGDGYQIHDYLEYNPPAAQVKRERAEAKERMQRARSPEHIPNIARTSGEHISNMPRSSDEPSQNLTDPVPVPVPGHEIYVASDSPEPAEPAEPAEHPEPAEPAEPEHPADPQPEEPNPSTRSTRRAVRLKPENAMYFVPATEPYRLAAVLRTAILARDRYAKVPALDTVEFQAWCYHVNNILATGRPAAQVEAIIGYAQRDSYWPGVIRNGQKLEEFCDTLWAQAERLLQQKQSRRAPPRGDKARTSGGEAEPAMTGEEAIARGIRP